MQYLFLWGVVDFFHHADVSNVLFFICIPMFVASLLLKLSTLIGKITDQPTGVHQLVLQIGRKDFVSSATCV